jgi:hypothetical protein
MKDDLKSNNDEIIDNESASEADRFLNEKFANIKKSIIDKGSIYVPHVAAIKSVVLKEPPSHL